MFIVDPNRFQEALKERGYHSLTQLAHELGMHRNTLHYYLSGRPPLPENFEKVIRALNLTPGEILIEKEVSKKFVHQEIAPLVDQLHSEFPDITFILFGSRAKGRGRKYSDWDLGVYCKEGLSHQRYRSIVRRKEDLVENSPYLVDLVNLNNADSSFLKKISKHWVFLTGRQQDWIELQKSLIP